MNLKFVKDSEVIVIPLNDDPPQGKRAAIKHNDSTYYSALVDVNDPTASPFTVTFDGAAYALSNVTVDPGDIFSESKNTPLSQSVTVRGTVRDFGVIIDANQPAGYDPTLAAGNNYWRNLANIRLTKANSTIIGNALDNTFNIAGGSANVLTGDLGSDTFIFQSGGGIITDFGIGAAQTASGMAFASLPTDTGDDNRFAYDRFDPFSYARDKDDLKINGTVVEIAYEGRGVAKSKKDPVFSAYVIYEYATGDDTIQAGIFLPNIAKRPTKTSSTDPIYQTNDVAANSLLIYEKQASGSYKKVSPSNIGTLSVTKANSAYPDIIAYLDSLYAAIQGGASS